MNTIIFVAQVFRSKQLFLVNKLIFMLEHLHMLKLDTSGQFGTIRIGCTLKLIEFNLNVSESPENKAIVCVKYKVSNQVCGLSNASK